MTTCPKCAHVGQDPDSCEKCGIIYDRMHTLVEQQPVGRAPPAAATDRTSAALAEAFPGARLNGARPSAPVPAIPAPAPDRPQAKKSEAVPALQIVPRTQQNRRLPWLLGTLAVVLVLWGLNAWRDHRAESVRLAPVVEQGPHDAAYFELALETSLADARRELLQPAVPARALAEQERLASLVQGLERDLALAPVESVRRGALGRACQALARFLKAAPGEGDPAALAEATAALQER